MNKSKTLIYIDSLLLSYEIKQESIGANINIIDVIGITEVNNVIYLALEVEYNDYCYLTHVELINMWACPNDDDKQEIKEELLSNLFEDVTIQSSNINVGDTKYKDFEEFSKYKNMDEENGFIIDITCGTYNGATNTFTPWRITDDNIIDTLIQALSDLDYYNIIANMIDEDISNWKTEQFIYELVSFENIFIIEDTRNIYIDRN